MQEPSLSQAVDPFVNVTTDMIKSQSVHVGSTLGEKADPFVESFWYWNKFSTYVLCLICIVATLSTTTALFNDNVLYAGVIGTLSSGIEVSDRHQV